MTVSTLSVWFPLDSWQAHISSMGSVMRRARVLIVVLCLEIPLASLGSLFAAQPIGTLVAECPEDPLPLPPEAIMQAAEAVRKAVPRIYYGFDTRRFMVQSGDLAPRNIVHGVLAKQRCGETVWQHTVVVSVGFPKATKLSLSQGVVFVSWEEQRWRVWGVLQMPWTEGDNAPPALPTGPAVDLGGCPENPLPLPPDAVAHAARASLQAVPTLYRGLDTRGAIARRAALAADDPRGPQVKLNCGEKVWHRTVVVNLHFPIIERETGSASGSQGTVFVSRFKGGWKVWEVAH